MTPLPLLVPPDQDGLRVDALLRLHFPQHSRAQLERLIRQGGVRRAARPLPKGERVHGGEELQIDPPPENRAHPNSQVALDVAFETPQLLVVNKPAGLPCAPLSGWDRNTLANGLLARYPSMRGFGYHPLEAGLVHRIDNGTSGLVLAAKEARSFEHLSGLLRRGQLSKRYLAVAPWPGQSEGVISSAIAPHPSHPKRVVCVTTQTGAAPRYQTRYRILSEKSAWCLWEVEVSAAYRHQIRVHLAELGCPLAGDNLYGSPFKRRHHALHASQISWKGDPLVAAFCVEAPLPPDLEQLLESPSLLPADD